MLSLIHRRTDISENRLFQVYLGARYFTTLLISSEGEVFCPRQRRSAENTSPKSAIAFFQQLHEKGPFSA